MTDFKTANNLLPFMKGIGIGKNGARNLDRSAADEAMTALLQGEYHPVTFGAFFMGMRYKGETAEELAGFLDAMNRTTITAGRAAPDGLLNCAGAYDGKARTCNVTLPAALVAVAAGTPIAFHGARNIPTKFGMTTGHILDALGIFTNKSVDAAMDDLHSVGIAFVDQATFNPAMHALLEMRSQMGKRTILNTMETLSNPLGASCHLGGFFHDAYAELICHALQKDCTSFQSATLVKGIEGSDELRPGAMFMARLVDGVCTTENINSDELDLPAHISELSAPTDSLEKRIAFSVQQIQNLLENPLEQSSFRNTVILNGAVRIRASQRNVSMDNAISMATEALDSGAAASVLSRWQKQDVGGPAGK